MTYADTNPPQLVSQGPSGGVQVWVYASADVHTDVDATDYFTGCSKYGMKVNDIVLVVKTTATIGATAHVVTAIDSDGNVTVSAAILS